MIKNEKGFTLIEMLIVLMIITVLILLIVPTLANRTTNVQDQGCEALKQTVQAQVNAYHLEKRKMPTSVGELEREGYISSDQKTCDNGVEITIDVDGIVQ